MVTVVMMNEHNGVGARIRNVTVKSRAVEMCSKSR